MTKNIFRLATFMLALTLAVPAVVGAQDLMVFPAQGQSEEQMEKDKYECYRWAVQQSGFDPMKVPTAQTAPPETKQHSGGVVRGTAKGAVVGTAVGAATGGSKRDVRRSARIGAGSGAVVGGARQSSANRAEQQKQQQWEQNEANNYAQQRTAYNRALAACLEGKGYTVK